MTVALDELPAGLADALTLAGYPGAVRVRGRRGPQASRYQLELDDARHLWVDEVADGAAPLGVPVTFPDRVARHDSGVVLSNAATAGGALVHETPWPATLLAERLTTSSARLDARVGHGLGSLLRGLHELPAPELAPIAQRRSRRPVALQRVLDVRDRGLAAADPWSEESLDRLLAAWGHGPLVTLHGEPATGHVLVPHASHDRPAPLAVLTGWSGGPTGPAWFDVGYLIGDLVEVAHLVPADARAEVLALARAVRQGYDPADLLPQEFWERTRDAAVLKLLDHEARIVSAFGEQAGAQVRALLLPIVRSLLDPRSAAGSVLEPPSAPSEGRS